MSFETKQDQSIDTVAVFHKEYSITSTLLLSTLQLNNRKLRCCSINFYCVLEWRNCIGIQLVDYSHCVTTVEAVSSFQLFMNYYNGT